MSGGFDKAIDGAKVGVTGLQTYCDDMNLRHGSKHGLFWFVASRATPSGGKTHFVERVTKTEQRRRDIKSQGNANFSFEKDHLA